jgi:hypothetical protein
MIQRTIAEKDGIFDPKINEAHEKAKRPIRGGVGRLAQRGAIGRRAVSRWW